MTLITPGDNRRPRRLFVYGLLPLAVGIPAGLLVDHFDSTLGGIGVLASFLAESLWMVYLSNK